MGKKGVFIGIDGAIYKMIQKFSADGTTPHIAALMKKGSFSDMLSQIPVATPINWASLTTGAVPGVHNVVGFWCHKKGDRIDSFTHEEAFSNSFVNAERLWESVERQGGKSIVMKFPGSWPPSVRNGIQLDGHCIPSYNGSILDLAGNGCFSTEALFKAHRVKLSPAAGWNGKIMPRALETRLEIPLKRGLGSLSFCALITGEQGYDTVLICREKDTKTAVFSIKVGCWSNWGIERVNDELSASVRFKLISLDPRSGSFRLYYSQLYPTSGWTYPDELGMEMIEQCGPMIEFASPHAWKYGWTDFETCYQEAEYQVEWMSRAAKYVMAKPWELFITQFHWVDHVQHYFLPWVDPVSPSYDKNKEGYAWEKLRQAYALADRLVGELTSSLSDDTVVFVLSDHGNVCDEYTVSLIPLFVREGFVKVIENELGKKTIDWENTVAYPCNPGNGDIYINLKGRDAQGCVPPEQFEKVRSMVISMLRGLKAPNGKPVYDIVLRSEDAVPLGIYGEYAPDIVTVYAQGMSWSGHGGENWDRVDSIFEVSNDAGMDYGAHHGPMGPCAETDICSNKAFVLAAGNGINCGYDRTKTALGPVRVIDIAPTLSAAMGYAPPRQTQGAVIGDFFAEC